MKVSVFKVPAAEWREVAEASHLAVFSERRPAEFDRIDFALVAQDEDEALGYMTCREFDAQSVYWQYGGGFPKTRKSVRAWAAYTAFIAWNRSAGYKRVTTLIENDNVAYLRMAMAAGFRAIGIRYFDGKILLEMKLDLEV